MTTIRKWTALICALVAAVCSGHNDEDSRLDIVHTPAPGAWCDDFTNTLAAAKVAARPILIVSAGTECSFCSRLNKAMKSTDFKTWQADRKIYMTHINDKNPQCKQTEDFQREGFKDVHNVPIVCVYWPKPDGTVVKQTFSGRRGAMPGMRHKFLQMELISALDKILVDYTASLTNARDIVHSPDSKFFKFAMAGGAGKVEMDPASGELADERGNVVMTATADEAGSVFWGWTDPNAKSVGYARKLVIDSGMTEGVYTANYRKASACKPPSFSVPKKPIVATAGEKFRFRLDVDEASRPMKFKAEGMPFGLTLDPEEGVFYGKLWRKGSSTITVTAVGGDSSATRVVRKLQLVVEVKNSAD